MLLCILWCPLPRYYLIFNLPDVIYRWLVWFLSFLSFEIQAEMQENDNDLNNMKISRFSEGRLEICSLEICELLKITSYLHFYHLCQDFITCLQRQSWKKMWGIPGAKVCDLLVPGFYMQTVYFPPIEG